MITWSSDVQLNRLYIAFRKSSQFMIQQNHLKKIQNENNEKTTYDKKKFDSKTTIKIRTNIDC